MFLTQHRQATAGRGGGRGWQAGPPAPAKYSPPASPFNNFKF